MDGGPVENAQRIFVVTKFSLVLQRNFVNMATMDLDDQYMPEYESLKDLLVRMARSPSVASLLSMVARKMAERPHVALTRIWLLERGDRCRTCCRRAECEDPNRCLHLAAAAESPELSERFPPGYDAGLHDRIPLNDWRLGRAVLSGRPFRRENMADDGKWLEENAWAVGMEFIAMTAQPLMHQDEAVGVIAVYPRIRLERITEGHFWLRMMANLAGFAVANARAIAQIRRLKARAELENAYLREEIVQAEDFGDIKGNSPPLRNILNQVELVAPTDATVLIWGESGTGKELIAREIHRRSRRREYPLIKVNCATIPGALYESEFFGHVKGAFTGALNTRAGRFQAADGGTIFLDEVGEIPLKLQSKLLRVLQEGAYERIGEDRTRTVDVRVIAATNRDLRREVAAGRFREDLYYRLNVFPIEVVPLRHRRQDIPLLAEHFLKLSSAKMGKSSPVPTASDLEQMRRYQWPGNVRELRNAAERAVITGRSEMLLPDRERFAEHPDPAPEAGPRTFEGPDGCVMTERQMQEMVRNNIVAALKACGGKIYGKDGAAVRLGIRPTTLSSRIRRMNIRPET